MAGQDKPGQIKISGLVIGGVSTMNNMGYTNPVLTVGGGVEVKSKQVLAITKFTFSLTHKLETKDGHSRNLELVSYKRIHNLLLGAGSNYSHLTTSQWEKSCWRPFIGVGYDGEENRIQVRYVTPSFDVQNRLGGVLTVFDYRGAGHWGTEIRAGIYRFKDTRVPGVYYAEAAGKHTGMETGLTIKYYF